MIQCLSFEKNFFHIKSIFNLTIFDSSPSHLSATLMFSSFKFCNFSSLNLQIFPLLLSINHRTVSFRHMFMATLSLLGSMLSWKVWTDKCHCTQDNKRYFIHSLECWRRRLECLSSRSQCPMPPSPWRNICHLPSIQVGFPHLPCRHLIKIIRRILSRIQKHSYLCRPHRLHTWNLLCQVRSCSSVWWLSIDFDTSSDQQAACRPLS